MKTYKQLLEENREWAAEIFDKIDKKMRQLTKRSYDKLPDGVDEHGVHKDMKDTQPHAWTAGFWGALNCLMYAYTKNEDYLKTAKRSEQLLDRALMKFDNLHHDVGFMWHILSGALYTLTGDEASRNRNLFAAATLASRFVLGPNYIRAWNPWADGVHNRNRSIIDTMMNLPLMFWASEQVDDDRFARIAVAHADMTLDKHLRADGSVIHIVQHDRESCSVDFTEGGQGYADGSSWSRGQAWAIYGFTSAYKHTNDVRYLDAAKRVANYFIAACADDWCPRCDFRSPDEPAIYDTPGGLAAASGLIELAKLLPEYEGGMYMSAALKMLHAMIDRFANFDVDKDYFMSHGTVRYPTEPEHWKLVHISIIYSDFFLVESVLKLLGSEFFVW